jgi:nitroimidazol reductase NimA-like FMN-containing flavoprotein (pyridoxamine 5'-phosphate oxidase superfamily)
VSRRDLIVMSDEEALAFLGDELIMTCASIGRDGRPHLMPLWYVVRRSAPTTPSACGPDYTLWAWTYGKSQKVVNLRRDPRATLQVEAGAGRYDQLRGVMIEADAVLHDDLETVTALGMEILSRYSGGTVGREAVEGQAPKRVGLEFRETRRVTWDHRKLGGTY